MHPDIETFRDAVKGIFEPARRAAGGPQKNVIAVRDGDVAVVVARGDMADLIERLLGAMPEYYRAKFETPRSSQ
jgi:hypothetical protein